MAEGLDVAIAALARRQRGYVTRPQLLELGLGKSAIANRLRIDRLLPVYSGVYAVGHLPTLPADRAFGAVLACGRGAALSHGSAVSLWGWRKTWSFPFDVTAPSFHCRTGIRAHRSRCLTRRDISTQLGVRVTSPARTILDVAPRMDGRALTRLVNDARQSQHLHLGDLADLLARVPRHAGAGRLRMFVEVPTGPTRSELEDAFLIFAETYGLPRPEMNTLVAGYEVDAFFPEEGVIVELEGYDFHSGRTSFESDRDRDADQLAVGLETVRVTWERMMGSPRREAERLNRILVRRRGERRV